MILLRRQGFSPAALSLHRYIMPLNSEFRVSVSEDLRLRLEALKNRLGLQKIDTLFIQGFTLLDFVVQLEARGGRMLIDDPGHPLQHVKVNPNAADLPSIGADIIRGVVSPDPETPDCTSNRPEPSAEG